MKYLRDIHVEFFDPYHLVNIACWISERTQQTGARLVWDPKEERFTNNDWGNFYLDRLRRKQYLLPEKI